MEIFRTHKCFILVEQFALKENSFDNYRIIFFSLLSVETKQSHPVSRTGSDRRPDAVREEGFKSQESIGVSESLFHTDVAAENLSASTPDR